MQEIETTTPVKIQKLSESGSRQDINNTDSKLSSKSKTPNSNLTINKDAIERQLLIETGRLTQAEKQKDIEEIVSKFKYQLESSSLQNQKLIEEVKVEIMAVREEMKGEQKSIKETEKSVKIKKKNVKNRSKFIFILSGFGNPWAGA